MQKLVTSLKSQRTLTRFTTLFGILATRHLSDTTASQVAAAATKPAHVPSLKTTLLSFFLFFFFFCFFVISTKALLQCNKKSQKLGENKIWKLKLGLLTVP